MRLLTVWSFAGSDTAQRAENALASLSARDSLAVDDGVIIVWPSSRRRPQLRGLQDTALCGAVGSAFWGVLFGTLFFTPALKGLSTSAMDTSDGSLDGVGVEQDFLNRTRALVLPGTSAIIVLAARETAEAVSKAFRDRTSDQVQATLTDDHQRGLRSVFAG